MIRISTICLLFTLFSLELAAQTATIRGFVFNKKNGEPVIFTNVYLQGTQLGAQTDVNGFYSITRIPEGNYKLAFTAMGFDSLVVPVSLKAGQMLQKNLNVSEKEVVLKEFEISSDKDNEQGRVGTGVTTITSKEINKLPTVGAEPDLAQYLQVLPGVTFTGDQGGHRSVHRARDLPPHDGTDEDREADQQQPQAVPANRGVDVASTATKPAHHGAEHVSKRHPERSDPAANGRDHPRDRALGTPS